MRKKDKNQVTEKSLCYFRFFYLILWSWWYNIWEGGISFTIPEICAPSFQEPPFASTCTILDLSRLSGNYGMGRYRLKFLQKNGLKPDSYPNAKIVKQMTTLIGSSILPFAAHLLKANHDQNYHNHHPSHLTGLMSDFAIPAPGHPNIASRLNSICVAATWPFSNNAK